MEKILVFNPFNFAPGFAAPMASELQDAIDKGHSVTYFSCNNTVGSCGFNLYGFKYQCTICENRCSTVLNQIDGKFQQSSLDKIVQSKHVMKAQEWVRQHPKIDLNTHLSYFDIGAAVLSSYISKSRDRDVTLEQNQPAIQQLTYTTALHFFALEDWFQQQKFTKLVAFNGRWDYYRAAFRIAQHLQVPVTIIEVLRDGGFIERIENNFPHSIKVRQDKVDELWENSPASIDEKMALGSKFFTRKRSGDAIVDVSYTQLQQQKKLPEGLNLSKPVITLYNSSDDEFVAMGEDYVNPFFTTQKEGVYFLVETMQKHFPDVQFVIRMHPNLKGLNFSYVTDIVALKDKYKNVFVELPESTVDSYALLEISEKVIVFGSTIGFEACYWGKPVILAGSTYYSLAQVAYFPENKEHLVQLIGQCLAPKPAVNAIKIGYYYLAGGEKSTYFDFEFRKRYSFKGKALENVPTLTKYLAKIQKALQLKNSYRWAK